MQIKLITPPSFLVVNPDEAEQQLRLKGIPYEIDEVMRKLAAAEAWAANFTERQFIEAEYEASFDCFQDEYELPLPPFIAFSATNPFTYIDEDGDSQAVNAAVYGVDTSELKAKVYINDGQSWPEDVKTGKGVVKIRFTCGYGDPGDVPADIKEAILYKLGTLYEFRQEMNYGNLGLAPLPAESLLFPYRISTFV